MTEKERWMTGTLVIMILSWPILAYFDILTSSWGNLIYGLAGVAWGIPAALTVGKKALGAIRK
jgi:hypothetical protein